MSGDDVCCSVLFGTLVGVFVFSVMWSELLMTSAIICPLWSSVYECQRVECAFTSPVWYVRDALYAVLNVRVSSFVVRGCGVLRRYIYVCYCDMFSVINVYHDHLKFCVVCINSRRYVCCSECDVVSNECNESPPALCNLSVRTAVKLCILGVLALGVSLVSRIIIMFACVSFMFTCSMMRFPSLLLLSLCVCVSSPVVLLGLFVRLSW